jgi:hypothetical protein
MAWRDTENAPVMTACEAITVAAVASTTSGTVSWSGTRRKNGARTVDGSSMTSAPWPR